jgi:hypothetical protein
MYIHTPEHASGTEGRRWSLPSMPRTVQGKLTNQHMNIRSVSSPVNLTHETHCHENDNLR